MASPLLSLIALFDLFFFQGPEKKIYYIEIKKKKAY